MASLPGVTNVEINANDYTATCTVASEIFKAEDALKALANVKFPAEKVDNPST